MFLVDGQTKGILKDGFQVFVQVSDWHFAVHAVNIAGNVFHWAGAEERHHGNDVVEVIGLHLHDVTRHAVAFHLEHANGVAGTDVFVGLRVIRRDIG